MIFEKKIEQIYRSQLYCRPDTSDTVFYFSAEDFEGLKKEPYSIKAAAGHSLQGYFYSYENQKDGRLVVFDHGMGGGGHRSYMREIETLARRGYRVFAYDHTGCIESGGDSTNGFAQSLCDLNDVICALKSDESFKNMKISVVGHSWGAFSSLNIGALHNDITHIVAMSGFCSVATILRQNFCGLLGGFFKRAMEIEREANPKFSRFCAAKSLKNTKAKVLVIHSDDDPTVSFEKNFVFLKSKLADKENIEFLSVTKKGHNPNFTEAAVKYKDAFFAEFQKKQKRGKLKTDEQKKALIESYDWWRMTEQDEELWNKIFEFLEQ